MPKYDFACDRCDHASEMYVPVDSRDDLFDCPKCVRGRFVRVFSPSTAVMVPAHMKAGFVSGSKNYSEWINSDATKAKLKSGEYEIAAKSDDINHA